MTPLEGELSPPFEIVEPAEWRAPIIFNSPHSGSVYPHEFLSASRIDLTALRRSEDSFMDELIAGLTPRGFPTVRVNFPRSYVDVNREPYELDPRMFVRRSRLHGQLAPEPVALLGDDRRVPAPQNRERGRDTPQSAADNENIRNGCRVRHLSIPSPAAEPQ